MWALLVASVTAVVSWVRVFMSAGPFGVLVADIHHCSTSVTGLEGVSVEWSQELL